jgi:hypothetical protein
MPMNTPLTREIWHLSIDDLLEPLPETPRLGGPGPFVINLSASSAPISQPIKDIPGSDSALVYQIKRTEDRRLRYRLRLGPFSNEDDADVVLVKVREFYPSALTATADTDDLRTIASLQEKADALRSAQQKSTDRAAAPKAASVAAAPAPAPAAPAPVAVAAPVANAPVVGAAIAVAPAAPVAAAPESGVAVARVPVVEAAAAPAAKASIPEAPPVVVASVPAAACAPVAPKAPVVEAAAAPAAKAPIDEAPPVVVASAPAAACAPVAPKAPVVEAAAAPAAAYAPVTPKAPVVVEAAPVAVPSMAAAPAAKAPAPVAAVAKAPLAAAPAPAEVVVKPAAAAAPPLAAPPKIPVRAATAPINPTPVFDPALIPTLTAVERVTKPSAVVDKVPRQAVAAAPVATPHHVERLSTPLDMLESTQTVRPLTPLELQDHEATRWFVIQLSLADEAFDPDSVPNLDIFGVYRLYSVAGLDQGRIMHALRLGFFGAEAAARAVASYLAAYYDKPTVKRVSAAERDRFAEERLDARKDIGATGMHAIIEITSERIVRKTAAAAQPKTPSHVIEQRTAARNSR